MRFCIVLVPYGPIKRGPVRGVVVVLGQCSKDCEVHSRDGKARYQLQNRESHTGGAVGEAVIRLLVSDEAASLSLHTV